MKQMHHNGVMVPPRYEGRGLKVKVKGEILELNNEQEERAMAWAKKIGTPYVEDSVFAENFHEDFSEVLGFKVLPVGRTSPVRNVRDWQQRERLSGRRTRRSTAG